MHTLGWHSIIKQVRCNHCDTKQVCSIPKNIQKLRQLNDQFSILYLVQLQIILRNKQNNVKLNLDQIFGTIENQLFIFYFWI